MLQGRTQRGIQSQAKWATSAGGHSIGLHWSNASTDLSSRHSSTYRSVQQKPILFLGGVHGDEPEGVWLAEATLEWLKIYEEKYRSPWHLITCLNPDGYKKNQRVNSNGVDLNRNFPEEKWSEYHTAPRYFPGPRPASEPEVKALIQLIDEIQPKVIIHCHSWKPCIVLTGDQELETARILSRHSGYEFKQDIGYPTPGSLGEYGWTEKKIPVICIEVEEKIQRSKIPELFRKAIEEIFVFGGNHD